MLYWGTIIEGTEILQVGYVFKKICSKSKVDSSAMVKRVILHFTQFYIKVILLWLLIRKICVWCEKGEKHSEIINIIICTLTNWEQPRNQQLNQFKYSLMLCDFLLTQTSVSE